QEFNTFTEMDCGEEVPPLNYEEDRLLTRVRGLYDVGGDFTATGDFPYKFTIDYKKRQIFFNTMPPNKTMYLEYIGSGINDSGETYIPIEAATPLRNYIMWQMAYLDPKMGASKIQMREDTFERSLAKMRHANSLMTEQEYRDEYYASQRQGPKR
ncbi:MAG: hypothetical protein ACTSR6_11860, partial [Candidatus Heimdallarchaeota archaeon]